MNRVLVVEDEAAVRQLLAHWVNASGCEAVPAENAETALALMNDRSASVALCDVGLPGQDGLWLAERLRVEYPDTAVVMETGTRDLNAAIRSLRLGALDYLVKPFGRERLREALERGLAWHEHSCALRARRQTLAAEAERRRAHLTRALGDLEINSRGTLDAMLSLLMLRDTAAHEHARRVSALATQIARALDVSPALRADIERAALLHDIGKMAVPEALLRKPAKLSTEELEIVRQHPHFGYELLEGVPFLAGAAEIVLSVPEHFDGSGYPQGLAGEAIPLGGRIIAAADAFDTVTHRRSFSEPLSREDAVLELLRCRGTQFDPRVVDALVALV